MKKVPKRKGYKNGGTSDGDPPDFSKFKKGDPLPEGYLDYIPSGSNYVQVGKLPDGTAVFSSPQNKPKSQSTTPQTNTPPANNTTPTGTPTTPTPSTPSPQQPQTPAPAPTPSPVPAKPTLTPAQQRAKLEQDLQGWDNANAQEVPKYIADSVTAIRSRVQQNQALLDAALAKKYGKAYNGTAAIGQALTPAEGAKILGKDQYNDFIGDIKTYEKYRGKTFGSYDTQNTAVGATDPNQDWYGTRMQNMFKNSPAQSAANTKKVMDAGKGNALVPQNAATQNATTPPVSPSGMIDGNNQSIPELPIDPLTGKPMLPKVSKPVTQFSKGGKILKGYKKLQKKADGGTIDLAQLSPEQLKVYQSFSPDDLAKFNSLPADQQTAMLTAAPAVDPKIKAIGSIAPAIGNLSSAAVDNMVKVDSTNVGQNMGKDAASMALKRAGQGAGFGMAFGPEGAAIGAGLGLVEGAFEGAMKGKKKAKDAIALQADQNQSAAADASFQTKSDGGHIEGAGTAKSDSIKAKIEPGSFVVPAENANAAERIRKIYLGEVDAKAKLNQGGGVPVKLSNGEHLFTADEVNTLKSRGVNLDALAPNQEGGKYGLQKGGEVEDMPDDMMEVHEEQMKNGGHVSSAKAKEILRDGTAQGHPLTAKQKRYFGWIAGGAKADGGEVKGYKNGGTPSKFSGLTDAQLAQYIKETQAKLDATTNGIPDLTKEQRDNYLQLISEYNQELQSRQQEAQTLDASYSNLSDDEIKQRLQEANAQANSASSSALKREAMASDAKTYQQELDYRAKVRANPAQYSDASPAQLGTAKKPSSPATANSAAKPNASGTSTTSAEKPLAEDVKTAQAKFLAEHGGIGSQNTEPTSDATKTAASVPAVDTLKKQWQIAADAGKVGDMAIIEKQMHDLGYNYKGEPITGTSQGTTKLSPEASDALGSIAAPSAATSADDASVAGTGQPYAPSSAIKKVYDSLGSAAGVAALGQIGLGVFESAKDKAPVYTIDPNLAAAQQKAESAATYGFSPEQLSLQRNQIETNRRDVIGNIAQFAGGNVGTAVGNTRLATLDANASNLALAVGDQQAKDAKRQYADQFAQVMAAQKRQIFEDANTRFLMNQQAANNLIGAGLSNFFGNLTLKNQQDRMDQRAQKWGGDPWSAISSTQTTTP